MKDACQAVPWAGSSFATEPMLLPCAGVLSDPLSPCDMIHAHAQQAAYLRRRTARWGQCLQHASTSLSHSAQLSCSCLTCSLVSWTPTEPAQTLSHVEICADDTVCVHCHKACTAAVNQGGHLPPYV